VAISFIPDEWQHNPIRLECILNSMDFIFFEKNRYIKKTITRSSLKTRYTKKNLQKLKKKLKTT
jgi:hypothetical protein